MEKFIDKLREKDLKATTQRINILKTIEEHEHISIDILYKKLKEFHPSLSLNTIYLNIDLLTQANLIAEVAIEGVKSKYEVVEKQHAHLICQKCGHVKDFIPSGKLLSSKEAEGFCVTKQSVSVYGICILCQKSA